MSNFSDVLKFSGTWRNYQLRVLNNSERYLSDGKIHIVAAPGSGKTTLGIELIIRIGEPVLILAPSITIREQWKERILEAFVPEGEEIDDMISQDLKRPAPITVATYQALHSAMTRYSGILEKADHDGELNEEAGETNGETDVEMEVEQMNLAGFNLIGTMQQMGIKVLCLDECHHLRSEWWKALEDYKAQMGGLKVIALTATPPYDSTPTGWNRYIEMCDEIDEEITVPELVKEGSLCPHQDYIYFNYPTTEETKIVTDFQEKSREILEELMQNEQLLAAVKGHKLFTGQLTGEEMLDEPSYLSAILIYMKSKNMQISLPLKRLLGARELPEMDEKWMEILLQKFLYDSPDDFLCDNTFRGMIASELNRHGLIERRTVSLSTSLAIEKMLISSKGKITSILKITELEYKSMGKNLRLLILTDYIRKEYEKNLGLAETDIQKLGVLPFFEAVRRRFEGLGEMSQRPRLGVLCGTIVIIPAEAKAALIRIASEDSSQSVDRLLQFSKAGQLSEDDYLKVTAMGSGHFLTRIITRLFEEGYIQVMIGTKSLLGEGWDSPCINSLILASFVGSFMMSNQMRGRAIRTVKDNLDKTSNIWHLVCIKPWKVLKQEKKEGYADASYSEDWDQLQRRMQHFMGLHYKEDVIENGTARLSCVRMPFSKENIKKTNVEMMEASMQRAQLKQRWHKALAISDHIEVTKETEIPANLVSVAVFYDAMRDMIIGVTMVLIFLSIDISESGNFASIVVRGLAYSCFLWAISNCPKLFMMGSPYRRLKVIGKGIVKAMKAKEYLKEEVYRVEVEHINGILHAVYIKGGTGREKEIFSKNIREFFGEVDNQRYLLVKKKKRRGKYGFYCVPEMFSGKKENAEMFASNIMPYIGKYNLVYTRSEAGRKILLEGRAHAYANKQARCISKKKVKSALE